MTVTSGNRIKRTILFITVLLFSGGWFLVFKSEFSTPAPDARQLLSILVTSYLLAWGGYALLSRIPRDEIRSQFVLMTISLGMALALAEVPAWFHLMDYRKIFGTNGFFPWEQPNFVPDRELLGLPQPGSSVNMVFGRGNIGEGICLPFREAEPFRVTYDQNGFRNEKNYTGADIVVIGDSYVESPMMPGSVLATTRLEELHGGVVVNLGQSGYGPQQELTVLKRYGVSLHPKWIVWVFYEGNDLVDAQRYEGQVSLLDGMWDSLNTAWDRSFTLNSLVALARWARGCVPNQQVAGNYGMVEGEDGQEQRIYFLDHSSSVVPTGQELEALQKTGEVLKVAYELARSEGAGFMVAFAPTKFRVYHDIARFDGNAQGDLKWWVLNDLPERLYRIVADISPDIRYVDLTPALSTAARSRKLVFIPDDTHWTSEGHQVVAETLHAVIKNGDRSSVAAREGQAGARASVQVDRAKDALIVRNKDGTIRYWSEGARAMYGWEKAQVLGRQSHQLLHTVFPVSLEQIESELLMKGYWEGQLVHERRDGTKVSVFSRWELQQDASAKDQSVTVVEINNKPAF